MVEVKSPSWVKHAVRRWKQFYNEILYADGHLDLSNPLSVIFRNEPLEAKSTEKSKDSTTAPLDSVPSKKEESKRTQPEKTPSSRPEQKQSKGRFLTKIKELQFLPSVLNLF